MNSRSDRIGFLFGHIADVVYRQADQSLQEQLGIGLSQLRIMTMLEHYPGTSQRFVADSLGQTEASISRQVKLLIYKGMIIVAVDPAEKRKRTVTLTTKGIKVYVAANEIIAADKGRLFGQLSDKQQDFLLEALDTLHEQSCQPGKLGACDHPFDLQEIYTKQREAKL